MNKIMLVAVLLIVQSGAYAQKSILLDAMKDEMARSIDQLRMEGEAGPYYLSYYVEDGSNIGIVAEYGAITTSQGSRSRSVKVDLRVGSYAQDNSNFLSSGTSGGVRARLPLDDDYNGLRRAMWLATDRAYKSAFETLSKKKSYLQNTVQTASLPDFSKGAATASLTAENSLNMDKEQWTLKVDQIAKMLTGRRDIQRSRVILNAYVINSYYINSEGAVVLEPYSTARLSISASTQAEDGMPLGNYLYYTAARPEGLPEQAAIESDIKRMISELLAARTAPLAESYSGPVLFVGQAAGELFNQGIAGYLAAKRSPVSDNPAANRSGENPFLDKISMKVAASFLSFKAAPTLTNYGQHTLLGSCKVDEEGVPCQDVSLIEKGILKNLLSSRTPVKGISQSNGHARGGAATPSVIQITSTNIKPYEQLKQDLVNAAKEEGLPYGYIVRGLTPVGESISGGADLPAYLLLRQGSSEPTQFRLTNPYGIFRVDQEGKETPVRGIEFGSININSLRNVIATSDDEFVYDFSTSASNHYATVITPSLLIGGVDIKQSAGAGTYPKLPIVSPPGP